MAFWYKAKYNLSESEIRYAMKHSVSTSDAARFLRVSHSTFKKYAEMYFDHESGLNLYQLLKKTKKRRVQYRSHLKVPASEILENKHPTFPAKKIKERLIEDGIFEEKCHICGFHEQRITDLQVGILLVFKDGNRKNHLKENLEFVCWNCYFLYYGDVREVRYMDIDEIENYDAITEKQKS